MFDFGFTLKQKEDDDFWFGSPHPPPKKGSLTFENLLLSIAVLLLELLLKKLSDVELHRLHLFFFQ